MDIITIEEHNEQFLGLMYEIKNQLIKSSNNVLLHIDEHPDMGTPYLNKSIDSILNNIDIEYVADITYNELNIADFIMPSVYLNIFKDLFWVRHTDRYYFDQRFIFSLNNNGKTLISDSLKNIDRYSVSKEDCKNFNFLCGSIDNIPECKNVILDIDLDYFSCGGVPRQLGSVEIEITKSEYDNFKNNRYNPIKYINIPKVYCRERDGHYYYIFNEFHEYPENKLKVDNETILYRINKLFNMLQCRKINPELIFLCKSQKSRFTPSDQVDFILDNVIKKINELYGGRVLNIKDIF